MTRVAALVTVQLLVGIASSYALSPPNCSYVANEKELQLSLPPVDGAKLGRSVAVSGDWAAVGAPRAIDSGSGLEDGVVLLLRRVQGEWELAQTLSIANDTPIALTSPHAGAEFGHSVAMHGRWLIVGARSAERVYPGDFVAVVNGMAVLFHLNSSVDDDQGRWVFHQSIQCPWLRQCGTDVSMDGAVATMGTAGFFMPFARVLQLNATTGWWDIAYTMDVFAEGISGEGGSRGTAVNNNVAAASFVSSNGLYILAAYSFRDRWFRLPMAYAPDVRSFESLSIIHTCLLLGHSHLNIGYVQMFCLAANDTVLLDLGDELSRFDGRSDDDFAHWVASLEWVAVQNITHPLADATFGQDVVVDESTGFVYVSDPMSEVGVDPAAGLLDTGAVFVFHIDGPRASTLVTKIVNEVPESSRQFGSSLAIHEGTLMVGAENDHTAQQISLGAVFLMDTVMAESHPGTVSIRVSDADSRVSEQLCDCQGAQPSGSHFTATLCIPDSANATVCTSPFLSINNNRTVHVTVERTQGSCGPASARVWLPRRWSGSGVAKPGVDAEPLDVTVHFQDGQMGSLSVPLVIYDDAEAEGDELLEVELSDPFSGSTTVLQTLESMTFFHVEAPSIRVPHEWITIVGPNDEPASGVRFAAGTPTTASEGTNDTILVERFAGTYGPVNVTVTLEAGTAAVGPSGDVQLIDEQGPLAVKLHWPHGQTGIQSIPFQVVADLAWEDGEEFVVRLGNVAGEGVELVGATAWTILVLPSDERKQAVRFILVLHGVTLTSTDASAVSRAVARAVRDYLRLSAGVSYITSVPASDGTVRRRLMGATAMPHASTLYESRRELSSSSNDVIVDGVRSRDGSVELALRVLLLTQADAEAVRTVVDSAPRDAAFRANLTYNLEAEAGLGASQLTLLSSEVRGLDVTNDTTTELEFEPSSDGDSWYDALSSVEWIAVGAAAGIVAAGLCVLCKVSRIGPFRNHVRSVYAMRATAPETVPSAGAGAGANSDGLHSVEKLTFLDGDDEDGEDPECAAGAGGGGMGGITMAAGAGAGAGSVAGAGNRGLPKGTRVQNYNGAACS